MLEQIIEEMIDPAPAKRPKKAAHVAKALRVFLAAEEHSQESQAEENIVAPAEKAARRRQEEAPDEEDEADEEEAVEEDEESPRGSAESESVRASGVKQLRCGTRSSPKYATLCFWGAGRW